MKKLPKHIMFAVFLIGGLMLSSCSSSPSDEEMKQLRDLKDQVSSLENKVATLQRDKAGLEKQIAEKNGKLQQCQSDQEMVKKGLGK
jgi:outer membrane murein-binding lipoprotein Lpp